MEACLLIASSDEVSVYGLDVCWTLDHLAARTSVKLAFKLRLQFIKSQYILAYRTSEVPIGCRCVNPLEKVIFCSRIAMQKAGCIRQVT